MKSILSKTFAIAIATATLFVAIDSHAAPAPGGGGTGTVTPTPVVEQEKEAKTAVQIQFVCAAGETNCVTNFQVPVGMRLVIESIVGYTSGNTSAPNLLRLVVALDGIPTQTMYFHATTPVYFTGARYLNMFNLSTRIYADSIQNLGISSSFTSASPFQVFGHLVKK